MTPIQKLLLRFIQDNAINGKIELSNNQLAKEIGVCSSSVFKCVRGLTDIGVIKVEYLNKTKRIIVLA